MEKSKNIVVSVGKGAKSLGLGIYEGVTGKVLIKHRYLHSAFERSPKRRLHWILERNWKRSDWSCHQANYRSPRLSKPHDRRTQEYYYIL